MNNWLIRKMCKLRIFVLYGWRHRIDNWRYRRGFSSVMRWYHLDRISLRKVSAALPKDTKHGPPNWYRQGALAAIRQIKKDQDNGRVVKSLSEISKVAPYVQSVGRAKRPSPGDVPKSSGRAHPGESLLRAAPKAPTGKGAPTSGNSPYMPESFA